MIDKTLYEEACILAQYRGYEHYDDYMLAIETIYRDLQIRKEQLDNNYGKL